MAKRRSWLRRLLLLLVAGLLTLLVVAGTVPNPFPAIWDWINRERPITTGMEWQDRVGGRPSGAHLLDGGMVLNAGRKAQIWDHHSGRMVTQWTAGWVTVAGSGSDAVVVAGEMLSRGYELRDPDTGAVVGRNEDARAVWGFADARLDLWCDGPRTCELRRYRPGSEQPLWTAALPGSGSGLIGPDPELTGTRVEAPTPLEPELLGRSPLPRLLGIPLGGDRLAVVETDSGRVLSTHEAGGDEALMVVGDRVISSVVTRREGVCIPSVTAYDAATGARVWGPEPYNLRMITGGGCEQRERPAGSGAALVAVGPRGNDLVVDANDGRVLWRGESQERVQAVNEEVAVIRAADPTVRYAVTLGGDGTPRWEHQVDEDAEVVLSGCGAVVADQDPDQVRVWDPDTERELISVTTSARVLACDPGGLVLASGRSLGFIWFPHAEPGPGGSGAPEAAGGPTAPPFDPK